VEAARLQAFLGPTTHLAGPAVVAGRTCADQDKVVGNVLGRAGHPGSVKFAGSRGVSSAMLGATRGIIDRSNTLGMVERSEGRKKNPLALLRADTHGIRVYQTENILTAPVEGQDGGPGRFQD